MNFPSLIERARKPVLYAVCGGSGVALDFLIFAACVGSGLSPQIANLAGYTAGTVLSFVLNRAITFRVFDAPVRRLASFFAVAGGGYVCSAIVIFVLVDGIGVGPFLAKAVAIVAASVLQFVLNTLITFRPAGERRA